MGSLFSSFLYPGVGFVDLGMPCTSVGPVSNQFCFLQSSLMVLAEVHPTIITKTMSASPAASPNQVREMSVRAATLIQAQVNVQAFLAHSITVDRLRMTQNNLSIYSRHFNVFNQWFAIFHVTGLLLLSNLILGISLVYAIENGIIFFQISVVSYQFYRIFYIYWSDIWQPYQNHMLVLEDWQ